MVAGVCKERLSTGMAFRRGNAEFHTTLISSSTVHSEGHSAVVVSHGGNIMPRNSTLAKKVRKIVQSETVNELGSVRMCTYTGDTKIKHVQMRNNEEL